MQAATANRSTALCPGMQCRMAYNNFLVACAQLDPEATDTLHQELDTFDQVGKISS